MVLKKEKKDEWILKYLCEYVESLKYTLRFRSKAEV